ncbi:hypothetical protein DH2020_025860 [Rehmannia glutinosa]|uniref:Uncharacterized protein n=1 Tax=Rehmannia glutinosa TaxID=99300 RepID=A0ABR0W113_REHGL
MNTKRKKTYNADIKDDSYAGKANRTMHKYEGHTNNDLMTAHVKLGSAKESQAYSHRREEEKYVALSESYSVKQVGRRQEKFIEGKGGILGDDMGLGKTMQVQLKLKETACLAKIQKRNSLAHAIQQSLLDFLMLCSTQNIQDKGVLLTTYDIVRNNTKSLCGDYRYNDDGEDDEITWDYMILDEGHLIKNPSTQRAKSLLQIPCARRIIISGTPLQNNLKLLRCKLILFSYYSCRFKEKYEHFINREMRKCPDREKRTGSSVAKLAFPALSFICGMHAKPETQDLDLRDCIQPYFLRRLKSEVFRDDSTLSKKNEIIVWLRLTRCQSEIVLSACDGSPLAALTILKKICDHPLLLTKRAAEEVLEGMDSIVDQEDHRVAEKLAMHMADVAERFDIIDNHDISCKISFILSLLADLVPKGHNVLIFSQTRKMLNLIQESLLSNHYKYMRIDGTTKVTDRAKLVKDFQEGRGAPIFLLTSQVGGLGLTLTNADRVIVVDPAWNPSTDNQSVDRAYRIGQKKDVIVYRLMTCGTVEEKIYRKQVFKGGLFRSATEHKEQIRYFSQQDLRDLFCLPKQGFDISPTQQQLLEEHDLIVEDLICTKHSLFNSHFPDSNCYIFLSREESLRAHVEFLETLHIAGVSHHSLLFSKAAPLQAVEIEEEAGRAHYAFNPKDIKKVQKNSSPDVKEPSEYEIRERINRLSHIFSNKVAVSRLPDKGEKIHKQISALYLQLDQLRMAKANKNDVIEL